MPQEDVTGGVVITQVPKVTHPRWVNYHEFIAINDMKTLNECYKGIGPQHAHAAV